MKQLLLILGSIIGIHYQCTAQSDSLTLLYGVSPFFSNDINRNTFRYPFQVQNSIIGGFNNRFEEPLDIESYFAVQIPFYAYRLVSENFFYSYGAVINFQFYESKLRYTQFLKEAYEKEDLYDQYIEMNAGVARCFYLDKQKKVMILLEPLGYIGFYSSSSVVSFDDDLNDDKGPIYKRPYDNDDANFGICFNMWLNYRVTSFVGLGFIFPKVIDAHIYAKGFSQTIVDVDNRLKVSIIPAQLPRLVLLGYF